MNEKMPATVRKRFIVKGRVQKVNYRDEVQEIAQTLGVTGTVKNLKSGDVEVICEGEETILGKFEKALAIKKSRIDVREVVPAEAPPSNDRFEFFEIKYGPMEEELGERLGAGFGYIQEVGDKVDGVGKAVECVGQKVECLGQKVDGVGKDVRDMHVDMNKRFDHMADHYDMIALTLKEAIVHMDRNAEKTDKAIEKSRNESAQDAIRTRKEIAKSQKETAKILSESRQEITASNRELARAVNFMIKKLSDKPPRRKTPKKR
jgi:acylphosphatase